MVEHVRWRGEAQWWEQVWEDVAVTRIRMQCAVEQLADMAVLQQEMPKREDAPVGSGPQQHLAEFSASMASVFRQNAFPSASWNISLMLMFPQFQEYSMEVDIQTM